MVNDVDCTDTGLHQYNYLDSYNCACICMGRESKIPTNRKWREFNEVDNISGQIVIGEAKSGEILGEIYIIL